MFSGGVVGLESRHYGTAAEFMVVKVVRQVKKRGAGKERKRRSDQTGRRVGKSVGG